MTCLFLQFQLPARLIKKENLKDPEKKAREPFIAMILNITHIIKLNVEQDCRLYQIRLADVTPLGLELVSSIFLAAVSENQLPCLLDLSVGFQRVLRSCTKYSWQHSPL